MKKKWIYSLRMVVCLVALQRMQELNTYSTAAILCDQAGYEPPVFDVKKAIFYTAHPPSPSTLRRSSTPSPAVDLSPRSLPPLSPGPPILPTPAGKAAHTGPAVPYSFDKLSFVKYVKNIGRDYREQAIKLVYFCRIFAQAQEQTRSSYDELRRYYSQIMPTLGPV